MALRLRLYGVLAAAAGRREVEVDAGHCSSIRCIVERVAESSPGLARALEVLGWDVIVLVDGVASSLDEKPPRSGTIYLLPPASGGAPIIRAGILKPGEEVDVDGIVNELSRGGVGAIVVFVGVVRSPNKGEEVEYLDYDYDPELTPRWLEELAREEAAKRELSGIAVYHYVGRRKPGERTMIVAVAASTRLEAFDAIREVVDRIKLEAPIWKSERRGGRTYYHVGAREISEDEIKVSRHREDP